MKLDIFIVDAFTNQQFKGNSAAVVIVEVWPTTALMQKIATENNLSETAFIKMNAKNNYAIRWFSPITEIDFCGHATLAASYILFNYVNCIGTLTYTTINVGVLSVVQKNDGKIEMNFPIHKPVPVRRTPHELLTGLSIRPLEVLKNRQAYIAVMASEQEVFNITYQSFALQKLAPLDVVVTAQSVKYDFVSRYFWPANGGDEDPVTGSIHSALVPYWADKLSRSTLVAYQASQRGGVLYCEKIADRVLISGFAVLYLRGSIYI